MSHVICFGCTAKTCVKHVPRICVRGAQGAKLTCMSRQQRSTEARAAQGSKSNPNNLVGEDAASFSLEEQTKDQWTRFFLVLGTVTTVLVRGRTRPPWHSHKRQSCIAKSAAGP